MPHHRTIMAQSWDEQDRRAKVSQVALFGLIVLSLCTAALCLCVGVPLGARVPQSTAYLLTPTNSPAAPSLTPSPTNSPTLPSLTSTPLPTPIPGPAPSLTSTSTPPPLVYPQPVLTGVEIARCTVVLTWDWPRVLLEDEYFAVRVGIGGPVHSIAWIKEQAYTLTPREVGECAWEVAICRGSLETGVCEQLAVSKQGIFRFYGCGGQGHH
jgi:hypothetical protein